MTGVNDRLLIMNDKYLPSIRILNLYSDDIYYNIFFEKDKPLVIKNPDDAFDERFKDIVPPNLDFYFLRSQGKLKYKTHCGEAFSYDFVNVAFNYANKRGEIRVTKKTPSEIRKYIYLNGFALNGKEYVRYKRSSGSAKGGSCLFIRKDLSPLMTRWSRTGLDEKKDLCLSDLTSYEAYRALSLSSLITTLDLNPCNILFVKDFEHTLKNQNVIRVFDVDESLDSEMAVCPVKNNIFDGEGLLDVSVFNKTKALINNKEKSLAKNGMMLLRSRFFKCCAFNTNLQQWFITFQFR